MTQVKCLFNGYRGMTPAAIKYAQRRWQGQRNLAKARDAKEAREEAAKRNVTLPKLKWMENKL